MAKHETVNFNKERVDYQDWLRQPVFKASWWSPAGAHVEALVQINQGERVSNEVIEALRDNQDPEGIKWGDRESISICIGTWNDLALERREEMKETITRALIERIIDSYQKDLEMNVMFARYNPQGETAFTSKAEILRTAVQLRSFQLAQDPGFQGA